MKRGSFLIAFLVLLFAVPSVTFTFELTVHQTTTGGFDRTPFWLQANRWGLYTDSPLQGSLGVEGFLNHDFGKHWNIEILGDVDRFMDDDGTEVRLRYGYGALSWRAFEIKGGTFPQIIGILPHPELSSGSMSVSGNARPLPKVQFSMPEWTAIPFTNETFEIQGGIAHGWFLGERVQTGALLHEKWGYGRFGPRDGSKIYLGLVHQGMWGGEAQEVNLDNFRRIFVAQDAGPGVREAGPSGNTLGIWDVGLQMPTERVLFHGYYHHYFELEAGVYWENGLDGLWGLGIQLDHQSWLPDMFVIESIFTKYQGGPYHFLNQILEDADISESPSQQFGIGSGAHQYYSHGIYRNGWTHLGRVIGTPFVVTSGDNEELRIASNRINGWHIAMSGDFDTERYEYTMAISQATHSPTLIGARQYSPVSLVPEGRRFRQWSIYSGFGIDRMFGVDNLRIDFGFGADFGDVYEDAVGFEIGLRWKLLSDKETVDSVSAQ